MKKYVSSDGLIFTSEEELNRHEKKLCDKAMEESLKVTLKYKDFGDSLFSLETTDSKDDLYGFIKLKFKIDKHNIDIDFEQDTEYIGVLNSIGEYDTIRFIKFNVISNLVETVIDEHPKRILLDAVRGV